MKLRNCTTIAQRNSLYLNSVTMYSTYQLTWAESTYMRFSDRLSVCFQAFDIFHFVSRTSNVLPIKGPSVFKVKYTCSIFKKWTKKNLMIFRNPLLRNHWANFDQTWHKASLGDVWSRDNCDIINKHWLLKSFVSRTTVTISTNLGTNHPWWRGYKFIQINSNCFLFKKRDNDSLIFVSFYLLAYIIIGFITLGSFFLLGNVLRRKGTTVLCDVLPFEKTMKMTFHS